MKINEFYDKSFKEQSYITSIRFHVAEDYCVICHIFKDWEYVELLVDSPRGGSISVRMNIDDASSKFLECFQNMRNAVVNARLENN